MDFFRQPSSMCVRKADPSHFPRQSGSLADGRARSHSAAGRFRRFQRAGSEVTHAVISRSGNWPVGKAGVEPGEARPVRLGRAAEELSRETSLPKPRLRQAVSQQDVTGKSFIQEES